MNFKYIYIILVTLLLSACEDDPEMPVTEKAPYVVEGWIEEGESPVVIVMHAVELSRPVTSFDESIEKWCRVSIFDGETRHVLSVRNDKSYTPSYIYTSTRLKGKRGHTYRLLVEVENDTIEAVSTIMPSPTIRHIEPQKVEGTDSLYTLKVFIDGVEDNAYFKTFSKTLNKDTRFYGTFLGTFAGKDYSETDGIAVSRGVHSTYKNEDFSHYFTSGDVVNVKVCSMEEPVYAFWKAYDSNVSLSNNMFFTFTNNCPSNINGALGYWAAYGCSKSAIRIPEK